MSELVDLYTRADPLEARLEAITQRLDRIIALLEPQPELKGTARRCRSCGQFGHDREHAP